MVDNTINGFSRSLERFRKGISDDQKQEFSSTGLEEVKLAIQHIQDQIGPDKKLRNFTRLKKFFEGMKQMEELVKIFLQVHEVVAFIWGPIKFVMMIAATRVDILELVLGVYQEIGDVLDGLGRYSRLFKNHPEARAILETYFDDVLQFHSGVLAVFSKPGWKRFFQYAWPTFKTRFRPIIDSLKRHHNLLSDEKLTVVIEEVQELSTDFNDRLTEIRQAIRESDTKRHDSLFSQKAMIITKIDPLDYESDQQMASRQRYESNSGDWILWDPKFRSWAHGDTSLDSVLFLHGMPGSGKTTLASRIIDHLRSKTLGPDGLVVFFYFKHKVPEGTHRTSGEMFRALLAQLLTQDDALLEYMHQQCAEKNKSEVLLDSFLKDCTRHCLMNQKRVWIVLDGLDECDEEYETNKVESQRVIKWLQEEAICEGGIIRLLVSGQRDGHIETILSTYPEIGLDPNAFHASDIERYTKSRALLIRERFSLDSKEEADIIEKVASASKGMFLYAKVVLDNLLSQESPADLDDELTQNNFPQGLDAAYERVVIRVLDRPSPARRKSAAGILGWLICSARPLRWREIQSRFCINLEKATCNFRNRRVDNCKIICGSLVETEPCEYHGNSATEQNISLVHNTAGRYLLHTRRMSLFEEHAKMAIYCSQYLSSHPFADGLCADDIEESALTGYYGLLDYALAFFQHHADFILTVNSGSNIALRQNVIQSMHHLLPYSLYEPDEESNLTATHVAVQLRISEWLSFSGDSSSIQMRIAAIRKVIEAIDYSALNDGTRRAFLDLNGLERFKCPKIRCLKFASGFQNQQERNLHLLEHDRPFKCSTEGCYARVTGFPSKCDLDSHSQRLHAHPADSTLFSRSRRNEMPDIHSAASRGDLESVKTLHKQGASLTATATSKGSKTPLVLAVRNGHYHICEYLLQQGVDPHDIGLHLISPMTEAIQKSDQELFRLFFSFGSKAKPILTRYVALAIAAGSSEILEDLLANLSPQHIELRLYEIFTILLRLSQVRGGHQLNSEPMLETVVRLQHRVFAHAFPSLYEPDGTTPRPHIHRRNDDLPFKRLSKVLREMSSERGPFLSAVFASEGWAIAECLLDLMSPGQLNIVNPSAKLTPLHHLAGTYVSTGSNRRCVRSLAQRIILLDGGVSANMRDASGNLPLHVATIASSEILDLIIQHTNDLQERNGSDETALESAVKRNLVDPLRQLLQSDRVHIGMTDMKTLIKLAEKSLSPEARGDMLKLLSLDRVTSPDTIPATSDTTYNELLCLFNELRNSSAAEPFLFPVSTNDIAGYYDVIKEPMDFTTVEKKLEARQYAGFKDFVRDFNLMFDNCRKYHHESSRYASMAKRLEKVMRHQIRSNPKWQKAMEDGS